MKKFLLAATLLAFGANVNAQEARTVGNEPLHVLKTTTNTLKNARTATGFTANKGTLTSPVILLSDSMAAGVPRSVWIDYATPLDSGYFYGTNARGDKGFAYLYDLRVDASGNNDTTVTILGFVSKWSGVIQPTSTKMINFGVWSRGTDRTLVAGHTNFYVYGKPSTSLGSISVKDTTLRTTNTFTATVLTTPITGISSSVYVGYTTQYSWNALAADTFGLRSTAAGYPASDYNYYNVSGSDTLLNVNNMVQNAAGVWKSPSYENGGGIGDMIMAPVVALNCPTCWPNAVKTVRSNDLTIYSNYPNPASNTTNIKFAIAQPANVTVSLLDNTGRLINTVNTGKLGMGEHVVALDLSSVAAGTYIYVIETSAGDRIAAQMTVAK